MDYANIVPAKRQAAAESSTTSKPEVLGLDYLATLKLAERVEVTVPFPVRITYTPIKDKHGNIVDAKEVRFYTSDLQNASFEVTPAFPSGCMVDAYSGEVGTLVVSCAKQDSMFEATKNDVGHTYIKFKAKPEFVSFNGRKAIQFADIKEAGVNLLRLKAASVGVTMPPSAEVKKD